MLFGAWLRAAHFFLIGDMNMFEDVEKIERMTYAEYRQVLYYFKHPDEYEGDYKAFQEKVTEFSSRVNENRDIHFWMDLNR